MIFCVYNIVSNPSAHGKDEARYLRSQIDPCLPQGLFQPFPPFYSIAPGRGRGWGTRWSTISSRTRQPRSTTSEQHARCPGPLGSSLKRRTRRTLSSFVAASGGKSWAYGDAGAGYRCCAWLLLTGVVPVCCLWHLLTPRQKLVGALYRELVHTTGIVAQKPLTRFRFAFVLSCFIAHVRVSFPCSVTSCFMKKRHCFPCEDWSKRAGGVDRSLYFIGFIWCFVVASCTCRILCASLSTDYSMVLVCRSAAVVFVFRAFF